MAPTSGKSNHSAGQSWHENPPPFDTVLSSLSIPLAYSIITSTSRIVHHHSSFSHNLIITDPSRPTSSSQTPLAQVCHHFSLSHNTTTSWRHHHCFLSNTSSSPSRTLLFPVVHLYLSHSTGMLFTISYASVLLVASLSCIWATPIAVNRDTQIQQRSESDLRSRAMEIGSLEARGLGFNSLSARGDVHAIHGRADRGEPMGARQPKAVKDFKFVRRVYPVTAVDSGNVASEVENFLGRALPYVIIPSHQTLSEWYQKHADALPASEDYFIVEFIFKLDNVEYQGVLVNPLNRPEEDGIVTETRGILYKERSRVYPPPPLSLMPGDQLRPLRLMVLNLEYEPVYTGYWITAFTFTKKIILDQSTADRDAKEIATQAQTLLARALPHVEVFGITANLYNRPSKHHPPHSLDVKSVEFTFQLLIETKEGTNSYLDVMEYRGVLINPLERSDHKGACFKRTIKRKTKPEGAYHSYVDSVKQIGSPPHDEVRVMPDIDLKPVKPQ